MLLKNVKTVFANFKGKRICRYAGTIKPFHILFQEIHIPECCLLYMQTG
jgi:hypothetical protein